MKIRRTITATALAMSAALLAGPSPASAAVIASEDFESPALGAGETKYGPDESVFNTPASSALSIAGFTFNGYSGILSNPPLTSVLPSTPFGSQAAFLQFYQNGGSSIDWTVGGLIAGDDYTLSFYDVGGTIDIQGPLPFTISSDDATFNDNTSFSPPGSTLRSTYQFHSVDFTANAAQVTFAFASADTGTAQFTGLDDFEVSSSDISPAPEPATWAMLLLGFAGAGCMMRASRRKGVAVTA
jgi:hypothetical protein